MNLDYFTNWPPVPASNNQGWLTVKRKERLTLMVCVSVDGTEKFALVF